MKKFFWFSVLAAFLGTVICSCRKEFKAPEWETELFTPVLTAKLGWTDLLHDTNLTKSKDNSLSFIYRKNIFDFSADSLLEIPDIKIDTFYKFPGTVTAPPGQTIVDEKQDIKFNIKDVELRELKLKSGFLVIKIKSYISDKVKTQFLLPGTKKNSTPFDTAIVVPGRNAADEPGIVNARVNLKGYTIDLSGKNGTSFNVLGFGVKIGIDASVAGDVKIYSRDTLLFTCTFENIIPEYGIGYLGQNTFNLDTKIQDFAFVKNVTGKIMLDSVKLLLNVENGVGADARIKINQFTSLNSTTGNKVTLTGAIMNQSLNISRALRKSPSFIPSNQTFTISSANSNINAFIENIPDKLSYTIDAAFNPLGDISGGNDFLYETSKLRVLAYLQIPLRFSAQNFTIIKNIDYSITSSDKNIEKGNLYLHANNGFPFSASLQLYLLDDNGAILDSLMTTANTIESAVIDADKRVSAKKQTRLTIPVDEAKLKLIHERKKIKAKLRLNTVDFPTNIVMYDNYDMDLKLVGDFIYNINLK